MDRLAVLVLLFCDIDGTYSPASEAANTGVWYEGGPRLEINLFEKPVPPLLTGPKIQAEFFFLISWDFVRCADRLWAILTMRGSSVEGKIFGENLGHGDLILLDSLLYCEEWGFFFVFSLFFLARGFVFWYFVVRLQKAMED